MRSTDDPPPIEELPDKTCPQCGRTFKIICGDCTKQIDQMPKRQDMEPEERVAELTLLLDIEKPENLFYPEKFRRDRIWELVGRHVELFDMVQHREALIEEARSNKESSKPAPRK